MSKITIRIDEFISHKGLSRRKFDISVGKAPGYFSNILKQGSNFSVDLLSIIIDKYPELNIKWVLTGNGEMLLNSMAINEPEADYNKSKSIDEIVEEKIERKMGDITDTILLVIEGLMTKEITEAEARIRLKKVKNQS